MNLFSSMSKYFFRYKILILIFTSLFLFSSLDLLLLFCDKLLELLFVVDATVLLTELVKLVGILLLVIFIIFVKLLLYLIF